ncbi:Abortive infection protein [Halothece sp. PCC 7418]|uniref:CPBP family intramembrane glutamic endopeptidase n=1 Tax=Halothece sp. (strain PCC 7418) TaxID=65093 RepID=UPI0002A0660E|nr:type II CAAX endopeptidase family protein [Halothece sp. PCC 7418]AFZ45709.1 Abortive infection protein [Halothece sp. PCC 7418]
MTLKRFFLILLTLFAVGKIVLSLGSSLSQPQIQARLELYQVNLSLNVTALDTDAENSQLSSEALLGETPYADAEKKYKETLEFAKTRRRDLKAQLKTLSDEGFLSDASGTSLAQVPDLSPQQQQLSAAIQEINGFIAELELKIGMLQAKQNQVATALETWQGIQQEFSETSRFQDIPRTASILSGLWQTPPTIAESAETEIKSSLDGWFQDEALSRLYTLEENQTALTNLQSARSEKAEQALFKLAIVTGLPLIGGLIGFGLLLFFLTQWLIKGKESVLATNADLKWETPWNWEITWQVLIVGFFFIGQILLPLVIGIAGISPTGWGIKGKAIFVLVTYILMSAGGLGVLYFSIRDYFPLPEGWFQLKGNNWIVWGIGGYLVAIPIVVIVSILNQQIWQGQGGSNPLLFLAVQAQDPVALLIFFSTAAIAAPIFEEIIFRGFLLPSLTRYIPVWSAIVLSSLLFSIAHLSLSEVLPLTALGLVLGVVYTRSRNILASMVVHSLWNSGTLLSLFVLGSGIN